jgi:cell wall-associated NlpC family hydrolase
VLALLGLAVAALVTSNPVGAATPAASPTAHNPIGQVQKITAVTGGLNVTGWAADPDALASNLVISAVVDGRATASATTSLQLPSITAKYHTGRTPGFAITIPVPAGPHTVCVGARNLSHGISTVLKCVAVPLGTALTTAQTAKHNPLGGLQHATASTTTARYQGWTSDPDWPGLHLLVVLYIDGRSVATVSTKAYAAPRPAKAGANSAFDITVPISTGAHVGCVWAVNVGLGHNHLVGCSAVDTRAGTPLVTTAAVGLAANVAAEAKKHIGQSYVWGAAGPKTFDCSGLVTYSYRKFGFATPRVAADQFAAARLIPAARAVPGDLVFYFDTEGNVYHVGIYLSPGRTVAAIDTQEGVNYQAIWDPTTAAYGSFTHI